MRFKGNITIINPFTFTRSHLPIYLEVGAHVDGLQNCITLEPGGNYTGLFCLPNDASPETIILTNITIDSNGYNNGSILNYLLNYSQGTTRQTGKITNLKIINKKY
jgi:hypothetical protein